MKAFRRFWYKYSPQLIIGELLEKRWMEPIVPFTLMLLVFAAFIVTIPSYASTVQLQQLMRSFPEQAFVAMAMALSILSGGIDLSVGAVFAMADFLTLYFLEVRDWPLPLAVLAVLAWGALIGAINGGLIAYAKTRPFLTTMVVLIILRAGYNKITGVLCGRTRRRLGRQRGLGFSRRWLRVRHTDKYGLPARDRRDCASLSHAHPFWRAHHGGRLEPEGGTTLRH